MTPLVTVKEIAKACRVTTRTIYALVASKAIPVHRVGRSLRFHPPTVLKALARK